MTAERVGTRRFSHPATRELEQLLDTYLPARPGFFVEAGANDGFRQSATYHLERFRGWRGVLVEPIPELYRACVRERPGSHVFNCALVSTASDLDEVEMRYGDLWSVVAGSWPSEAAEDAWVRGGLPFGWEEPYVVRVPARTLTSLLDEVAADAVDFLSLDVEGYEPEVLAGLDFDRHAPAVALVEVRDTDPEAKRRAVDAAFAERYDPPVRLTSSDLLYVRRA